MDAGAVSGAIQPPQSPLSPAPAPEPSLLERKALQNLERPLPLPPFPQRSKMDILSCVRI